MPILGFALSVTGFRVCKEAGMEVISSRIPRRRTWCRNLERHVSEMLRCPTPSGLLSNGEKGATDLFSSSVEREERYYPKLKHGGKLFEIKA